MRLAAFSDIHLEKRDQRPWLFAHNSADAVILAGDIHTKGRGVKWAQDTFDCPVIYVLGNHEGWGEHWQNILEKMKKEAEGSHVSVLNNQSLTLGSVRFLGSTLWTGFDCWPDKREAMFEAGQGRDMYMPGMRDYKYIRTSGYRKILPRDTLGWNSASRQWLLDTAQQPWEGQTVVVTHHSPLIEGLRHGKVTEVYDAAYANDWEEGVKAINADCWFYGHTHTPRHGHCGKTLMVSHPVGHVSEKLHPLYTSIIDVDANGCRIVPNATSLVEPPALVKGPKAK